MKKTSLVLT